MSSGESMKVGLLNQAGKYLTHGHNNIDTSATLLGRQQTWDITQVDNIGGKPVVVLKSQDGLDLFVLEEGTVRCATLKSDERHGLFQLTIHDNGNWSLKSLCSHKYLESDVERVFCFSDTLSYEHEWIPHLAIHAHILLYHPQSGNYAQVDVREGRVFVDISIPYLESCGLVLRFKSGKYHFETATHLFLSSDGNLESECSPKTAFYMDLRPGYRARFRNVEEHFMYPQGTKSTLLPGQSPSLKKEWFIIKQCPLWVTLQARNHGYLTISFGDDVKTSSKAATVNSLFHYQMDAGTRTVRFSDTKENYLALRKKDIIVANGLQNEKETAYKVRWTFGKIYIRACNDAYLSVCETGYILAKTKIPDRNEEFILRLCNRPFVVLRGSYGYIGHFRSDDILQCNSPVPECIEIIPCKMIIYHLKGHGRKFWNMTHSKLFHSNGRFPSNFCIDIRGQNILTIMSNEGLFLRGDKSGLLIADSPGVSSECLWEF